MLLLGYLLDGAFSQAQTCGQKAGGVSGRRRLWRRPGVGEVSGQKTAFWQVALISASALALASGAAAQGFNQTVVFGDSSVDSGYYKLLPNPGGGNNYNLDWPLAVAAGAGKPTTSPGAMESEALAAHFGLSAIPSNQPGGTNYATSGAKDVTVNDNQTGGFKQAIPTVIQIENYLAATGGRANSNALFLISSGANDVSYALGNSGIGPWPASPETYLRSAAGSLAASVTSLRNAGARYFIVPDLPYSFPTGDPTEQGLRLLYSQTLWSDLAAAGVNFVPADINAVRLAITANPSAFGFATVSNTSANQACQYNAASGAQPVTSASALLCGPAGSGAPYTYALGADQTHLFADEQHLTTAGQKIMADYMYSLIVAPSEISLLAENAVKARTNLIGDIRAQIEVSQEQRGPLGVNFWVIGDTSRLKIDNPGAGFSDSSADPMPIATGADFSVTKGLIVGVAFSAHRLTSAFSLGGDFTEHEVAGSLYAALERGPLWGNVIGTYGALNYDVNRLVPIGVTTQSNRGSADGSNASAALEGGYRFALYSLTHGPVAGFAWQHAEVGAFTEGGSFASLAFGSQTRDSAISELGYRVSADLGNWRPFVQAAWSHEFEGDRTVRAWLTTVSFAPGYSLPAVILGKDWGTLQAGATFKLAPNATLLGAFTSEFGDRNATNYGGRLGLNIAF
jgi:outer membrane lipase/esterase